VRTRRARFTHSKRRSSIHIPAPDIPDDDNPAPCPALGFVYSTEYGLQYDAGAWSFRTHDGPGVVALRVGVAEFLHRSATTGGMRFCGAARAFTHFPCHDNLDHGRWVGRQGSVWDGLFLIRLRPDAESGMLHIHAAFNDAEDHDLVILLHEDVRCVRGHSGTLDRTQDRDLTEAGLLIEHEDGPLLRVLEACSARRHEHAPGVCGLALVLRCRGFAANSLTLATGLTASPPAPTRAPRFHVQSSADPDEDREGATAGVMNPVYDPETIVDTRIRFGWNESEPFHGYAELEILDPQRRPVFRERVPLPGPEAAGGPDIDVRFTPTVEQPGVYDVWGRLVDAENRLVWTDRFRAAYDWRRIRPALRVEPDFDAFWDTTLAQLRAQPLAATTERVARLADHPAFEIHDVTFASWDNRRLHAMLFVPRQGARPLPALLTAHPNTTGYGLERTADGVFGSEIRHDPRFVTIVPLIRGHAPDATGIPFNHPWWGVIEDRETYVARDWYCAMVRAVDYLATRPELVDLSRVAVAGGSQGGALALVAAGLDPRIACCFADCPSHGQRHMFFDAGLAAFGPVHPRDPETIKTILSYYNPVNFCPRIRCPTYVGVNIGDLTVHSLGPLAAFHNLTGLAPAQKDFFPGFTREHGSGPGLARKRQTILDFLVAWPLA